MLGRRAAEGAGALGNAVAFDGPQAVDSAATAASSDIATRLSLRIVAGVPVVGLEHDRFPARARAAGTRLSRRLRGSTSPPPPSNGCSISCSTSRRPSSACGGWPARSRARRGASTRWSTLSCRASSASATRSRWCSPSASSRIASGCGERGQRGVVTGNGRRRERERPPNGVLGSVRQLEGALESTATTRAASERRLDEARSAASRLLDAAREDAVAVAAERRRVAIAAADDDAIEIARAGATRPRRVCEWTRRSSASRVVEVALALVLPADDESEA